MSALVPITLFGWIPLVIISFTVLPPRRAVIAAYLIGWLFLPVVTYDLPGLPDYGKWSATNFGVAAAALLFDSGRIRALRWRLLDLAPLAYCCSPMLSSLANDLGAYDGFSSSLALVVTWGLPYVVGRAYFSDGPGLSELALGVALGGLVYVPLCWFEIRMSPQLHALVYGYSQHAFDQAMRGGGWRPMVFMQHGLAVGLWMAAASVVAFTWWRWADRRFLLRLPARYAALALVVTTVFCKSSGATMLMFGGLAAIWLTRRYSTPRVLLALAWLPLVYVPIRASGVWAGEELVDLIARVLPERASSLGFRLQCEELLSARAREQWLFGWGGWSRSAVFVGDENEHRVVTDSLWILVFGRHGVFGLAAVIGMLVLPVMAFARSCPRALWRHPKVAPVVALAVVLSTYMVDNLVNDMPNPLYLLIAGGLGAVRFAAPRATPATDAPSRALPSRAVANG